MNDRELLEAAAKAAGNGAAWYAVLGMGIDTGGPFPTLWNPLTDDSDALRLAVSLRLDVHFELNGQCMNRPIVEVMDAAEYQDQGTAFCAMQDCTEDAAAAVRRAIVRAAAAMAAASRKPVTLPHHGPTTSGAIGMP